MRATESYPPDLEERCPPDLEERMLPRGVDGHDLPRGVDDTGASWGHDLPREASIS